MQIGPPSNVIDGTPGSARSRRMGTAAAATAVLVLLVLVSSLVVYKTAGALRQIDYARANGAVALKGDTISIAAAAPPVRTAAMSLNYFAVIWPALVFGVLIGGAVRAF